MPIYHNSVYERGWNNWHFKITYPYSKEVTIKARTLKEAVNKFKREYKEVSYTVTEVT